MKRITSILFATLIAVFAFAQTPGQKPLLRPTGQNLIAHIDNAVRSIPKSGPNKARRKAASDYVIITEQPEGVLKTFKRSGNYLYVQDQSLYVGTQSGNVSIVFGEDNSVYILNPLMDEEYGSWVKGTYDEAAGKVIVPVPQNLYYASDYDACIALIPINNYNSADESATEITYRSRRTALAQWFCRWMDSRATTGH